MITRSLGFSELLEQYEGAPAAMHNTWGHDLPEHSFVLSFVVVIDGHVLGSLNDIAVQLGGHPDIRY
ncbi:hypothetical protein [Hymenobacter norwichensis]|uniref:hypothetical protein n=1 Tax=Hymenobacter norwichensis TaxID=223903 RepID=UPI0003B5B798|nr:hypothetical protein [Hymenobacter norwichensis]